LMASKNMIGKNMGHITSKLYFEGATILDLFEDICVKESLGKDMICPATEQHPFSCKNRLRYYHYLACMNVEKTLYVKPTFKLVEFLAFSMDNIVGGGKYFDLIKRADGTYLLECRYSTIIGSRWLAVFNDIEFLSRA